MLKFLLVAIGGALGSVSRFLVSEWAAQQWGADFPYGTLLVNCSGCFMIGLFMTLTTERFIVSPYWRLVVTVGFIGGLTTFSSFSWETFALLQGGDTFAAVANMASNLGIGFTATWLGITAARTI